MYPNSYKSPTHDTIIMPLIYLPNDLLPKQLSLNTSAVTIWSQAALNVTSDRPRPLVPDLKPSATSPHGWDVLAASASGTLSLERHVMPQYIWGCTVICP